MIVKGSSRTMLLGVCALLGAALPVRAQDPDADTENTVRVAYLYRFTLFVDWPKGAVGGNDKECVSRMLRIDRPVEPGKK